MKQLSEFHRQNLPFRFLFTDIDDTLTTDGRILPEAFDALWRLSRAGISVIPVTGRPAGWCDLIIRQWPVDAVVGENGAFVYYRTPSGRIETFVHPSVAGDDLKSRLDQVQEAVLSEVPGSRLARDNFCRVYDLAIDFREDPPDLGFEAAEKIKAVCERFGAVAKISSIHVNAWFGDYDKLSMVRAFMEYRYHLDDQLLKTRTAFCGDSPNDEPMFEFFPNSFGVGNLKQMQHLMSHLPAWISEQNGSRGFAEIAGRLLPDLRTRRRVEVPPVPGEQLRVAIFTDSFLPQINGVVTSIIKLAENLADRGHYVIIFAPEHRKTPRYRRRNIYVHLIPSVPAHFYQDFRWVAPYDYSMYRTLRKADVDVVHAMTPTLVSLLGMRFARKLGLPVVFSFHTLITDHTYYEHMFKGLIKVEPKVVWKFCNYFNNASDLVVSPSNTTTGLLKNNGCKTEAITVSNGIDPRDFDNTRADQFRTTWGLKGKTVLFIGRIAEEKSINVLIHAFDRISASIPEARLLIVGDGPQREELQELGSTLSSASSIIFTGKIPRDELVRSGVFGACELFASPSRTETQGISILEALVNHLPCIVVNEGAVPELVQEGVNGKVVAPENVEEMADAIALLLKDDDLRERLSRFPDSILEPHLLSNIIRQWEHHYYHLLARNSAGELPKADEISLHRILSIVKDFSLNFSLRKRLTRAFVRFTFRGGRESAEKEKKEKT
jgi:1,2-diacylglycerol 3-alpha-glucosyltransferase